MSGVALDIAPMCHKPSLVALHGGARCAETKGHECLQRSWNAGHHRASGGAGMRWRCMEGSAAR